MNELPSDLMITVCAECLQASCWQYIFLCDKYKTANVIELPVKRLKELGREHPDYWEKDPRAIEWRNWKATA